MKLAETFTNLAETLSEIPSIKEIDNLKKEVDSYRPISKDLQNRIFQTFRLRWTFHSNAIEGNPLTYGETVAFIMEGITAKGKRLKDHLDIKGHNEAIDFILEIIKDDRDLSEVDIKNLHKIILVESYRSPAVTPDGLKVTKEIKVGDYKTSPNHVITSTGETHYYASVEETPILMGELVAWHNKARKNPKIHPLILASLFHHQFVAIHPFDDGNGRMARMLMNLILLKNQFPPVVVRQEDRHSYYGVLRQADANEYLPIVEYLGALLKESLGIQLKGIKGEDISEKSDLDKEIALLKASFEKDDSEKEQKNDKVIEEVIKYSLHPLLLDIHIKGREFDDLFFNTNEELFLKSKNGEKNFLNENQFEDVISHFHLPNYFHLPIDGFRYCKSWMGFKKSIETFNSQLNLHILFNKYKYSILLDNNSEKIEKFYSQKLTKQEIQKIVEFKIREVIESIKRHTQS